MDRRANERAAHAYIAVMISALCHSYTVRNKHNTVESKTNYGPNAALITRTHVRYSTLPCSMYVITSLLLALSTRSK